MSTVLLQVRNLVTVLESGKTPVRAVDGVSFDIRRDETFALLGESGCGKSMTALSIMRLLPDAGRVVGGAVLLDGGDLLALPEISMRAVRGKRIAMIFQEPMTSLNPVLTVGQQIAETLERHTTLRGAAMQRRVIELLDEVGIPNAALCCGDYPFQLSGGMKQRVMIAIALACEPELLIADEPTTALDVTIQAQVLELLRRLQRKRGMAILLITHDLGVVAEMANRVAVMYAGEIVELAERADFFADPRHPYTQKLFASQPGANKRGRRLAVIEGAVPRLDRAFVGCRFAERCDKVFAPCREQAPAFREIGQGRGIRCHLQRTEDRRQKTENSSAVLHPLLPSQRTEDRRQKTENSSAVLHPLLPSEPVLDNLLEVSALKIHFPIRKGWFQRVVGQVKAVDGVSLNLRAGRTLALVGESGCGKTTVGKGILQLLRPSAGSVRYAGFELTGLSTAQLRRYRADLQVIFQDPYASLDPRMRVGDILEEGMVALRVGNSESARSLRMDELLHQVGLAPEAKYRYPHEFSGGQRQRIAIARALAVSPKLIVCDEPTSALDVSVQAQILNLLESLQADLRLAYLFITHNLAVVEYFAHEVAVMYLGRIVERGAVEELMHAPRHPYTQALLSAVPMVDPASRREIIRLAGDLPSPANPPVGCHFHPRCPQVMPLCREKYPGASRSGADHEVCCHLYADQFR
ncbi:MAG: ABC transporter ATP-binding protein [Sulfuricellaceae bacterium]